MSHDDGRQWRAPGSEAGAGQPEEAASSHDPGGWWANPGEGVPSGQSPWTAPGGAGDPGAPGQGAGGYGQSPGPYGGAAGGQAPPGAPPGYGRPWAPRPGVVSLRPLTLGDILNGAFGYIRHNPRTTLGLALVVTAVFSVVTSVGLAGYFSDYGDFMQRTVENPNATADEIPFQPWTLATMYGGAFVSAIGQILLTGLLAAVVGMAVLGRSLSMGEALRAVRGRIGAVFAVAGLLFLLGLLWTALLIGLFFGAILLGMAVHPAAGVLLGLLGLLALIALAAWVYVRVSLAMPVAVLERSGPVSALGRSWRLTQHSWWRVFGILLLAQVITALVVNVLATPFQGVGLALSFFLPDAAWMPVVATAAAFIGTVLSGTLGQPFVIGVTTLLYIDLRMRREGLDLQLQTAAQSGADVGADVYRPENADRPVGGPPGPSAPGQQAQPGAYGPGAGPPSGPGYAPPASGPYGPQGGAPPQEDGRGWHSGPGGSGHPGGPA
ncbi:hypothetical protein [Streptomonospora litoralis]|uniref:Membrane domain of glycerophosphoryl diester phosphodiesterase n=1 Tax=Streptomonospora litoralis TaxID=2498135 RepID=A0A4P6PX33_9ACTN|nr:hypothetical protein [Streptomonospora litoralis]QBI52748.1 Membrane domain of glycerophosphoryl diester phosphodiesterase [Streptomonospora litoralis]